MNRASICSTSSDNSESPGSLEDSPESTWNGMATTSDDNIIDSFFIRGHEAVVPQATEKIKKIRNVKKNKKYHCSVCGDAPTGYHYDVLSCNGCKTFFRRTIISKRSFECSKGGNCEFTKDFRCSCRACRFAKCIKVGMNRAAIQFPTTDGFKKTEMELKPLISLDTRQWAPSTISFKILEDIIKRENVIRKFRRIDCPIIAMDKSLDKMLDDRFLFGRSPPIENKSRTLYKKNPVKYWMITDLFLVVEFAKTFQSFYSLNRKDQKILLGHVAGSLHVCTQAFYSYHEKKCISLTFPDGVNAKRLKEMEMYENEKLRNNQLVQASSMRNAFQKYFSEVYSLPIANLCDLRLTTAEYTLFKSICLFSPDETELSEEGRQIVQDERLKLLDILRKHIFATYATNEAVERFATMIFLITTFKNYGEKRRSYLEMMHFLQFTLCELAKDIYIRSQKSNWKNVADELCLFAPNGIKYDQ